MLTAEEQKQVLKAAIKLAAEATKTERLRQINALPRDKHSSDFLKARAALVDLLKEVG